MFLIGEILCGLPYGVFQTITTAYVSVCPVGLRAYVTTYNNLCWVIGHFIASGVLRGMVNNTTPEAYRIPFEIQWMWPSILIAGVSCTRVSLVSSPQGPTGRSQRIPVAAHNQVRSRLRRRQDHRDVGTYQPNRARDFLRYQLLSQSICCSTFIGYSTTFYEQAGLPTVDAFDMFMALYGIAAIGTLLSWWVMTCVGRRRTYLVGLATMCVVLFIVGMLGIAPKSNKSVSWAVGSMILVFAFVYDSTVGPVCYALVAEMSSTRLRAKSIVIARNFYNIAGLVTNILINDRPPLHGAGAQRLASSGLGRAFCALFGGF